MKENRLIGKSKHEIPLSGEVRAKIAFCQEDRELTEILAGLDARRKTVLFGAGRIGRLALEMLRSRGVEVACFLDSDTSKKGTKMEGVPVLLPEELFDDADRTDILITSVALREMVVQLHGTPLFDAIRGALFPFSGETAEFSATAGQGSLNATYFDYRSYSDLSRDLRNVLPSIPNDVDLIVGIPKSGMIPAMMLGVLLGVSTTELDGFLEGRPTTHGIRRAHEFQRQKVEDCKKVLIVDDCLDTGRSLREAKIRIAESRMDRDREILYMVAYRIEDAGKSVGETDIYCDAIRPRHAFEWNWMNSPLLSLMSLDIDGVLCRDPEDDRQDDGEQYRHFLETTSPIYVPRFPVQCLITHRLEKHRALTEHWLAGHGIRYNALYMLDASDENARKRLAENSGEFKAGIYRKTNSALFVESDHEQAVNIARSSGKPVLSIEKQRVVHFS